jgi:hypothetical protein
VGAPAVRYERVTLSCCDNSGRHRDGATGAEVHAGARSNRSVTDSSRVWSLRDYEGG